VFFVDTNILVYAVNLAAPERPAASAALNQWLRGTEQWCLSWQVVYEFLRATTHRKSFRKPLTPSQAWRFIEGVLAGPVVELLAETGRHGDVLSDLLAQFPEVRGSAVHDLHLVALMKEHGISEIRTTDADFRRFPFLRVVNPLA
jgi:toxin-antitoxin system PIN domain toxin